MPTQATLLITDVVDSTKLAETLGPERTAARWTEHDRVARDLLAQHQGREIDKSDGFLLLFDAPAPALAFALAYHAALVPLDLQSRVGVHTGEVVLRENPAQDVARGAKPLEVDGVAKALAARVMSLALGGQTLVTSATLEALNALDAPDTVPTPVAHGHWRLKGVTDPLELYEIGYPQTAPLTPPPDTAKAWRVIRDDHEWVPVRDVPRGLPAQRDAFVGRTGPLHQLAQRFDEGVRLVSVVGIGGTGKTRLALHFGWTWLGGWPGGVWFCDLSEARSVEGIVLAVGHTLGVPLSSTEDPVEQLANAIAGRGRCLVVLDNFEQVARHARKTLGVWLDRAPDAQFLVTTREVLGIPGETALPLPPLTSEDAVALFDARAAQAAPSYTTEPDAVAALVALLDDLPLAIELAAARVRVMSPGTMLERMGERFRLLVSRGDRHERQATLRATLDWSWDLLTESEQHALAQLSVFEGGFTLEGAEAVIDAGDAWAADLVQALVDKSLVRVVDRDRFDLLLSVQTYAADQLERLGQREAAETRHGILFAARGASREIEALHGPRGGELRKAWLVELDNVVVATRRAVHRGDEATATGGLAAAWAALSLRGPFELAVTLGQEVLAMDPSPAHDAVVRRTIGTALKEMGRLDAALAHAEAEVALHRGRGDRANEGVGLGSLANVLLEMGRVEEASTHYEAALAIHREAGNRAVEGVVLGNLGNLHNTVGRIPEALDHFEAALAIHRDVRDRQREGTVLLNLGVCRLSQGQLDEAAATFEAALVIHRELGNLALEARVWANLGILHDQQGRVDEAKASYEAAIEMHRRVGNRSGEARVLGNLGTLLAVQGQLDDARKALETALAAHEQLGDRTMVGNTLGNLGNLHLDAGRTTEAREALEGALRMHRDVGSRRSQGHALGLLGRLHLQEGRVSEARACVVDGERQLREVGSSLLLAMVLCTKAQLEAADGQLEAARAALHEAEALATQLGAAQGALAQPLDNARTAVEPTG